MILRRCILLLAILALTACSQHPRFLERQIAIDGHIYRYRVWLPRHYTTLHRWPVILYLHGSGERGDDNLRQLTNGLPVALGRYQERYRSVVVIPQARFGQEWYGEMELQALAALEQSIREFKGDRHRVYLTGMSMGGAGAWYMARHRNKFAAVVPVCGEVSRQPDDPFPSDPPPDLLAIVHNSNPFDALAAKIGKTPVWAFHGGEDPVISVEQSRRMVAALRAHGGNVRYTEYPHGQHEIWDDAYGDRAMVKWLLQQKR